MFYEIFDWRKSWIAVKGLKYIKISLFPGAFFRHWFALRHGQRLRKFHCFALHLQCFKLLLQKDLFVYLKKIVLFLCLEINFSVHWLHHVEISFICWYFFMLKTLHSLSNQHFSWVGCGGQHPPRRPWNTSRFWITFARSACHKRKRDQTSSET